jgi:hypothetical protein
MSDVIQITSEVNFVDYFLTGKMSFGTVIYKMMCGALAGILVAQTNAAIKLAMQQIVKNVSNGEVKVNEVVLNLTIALVLVVALATVNRSKISCNK